MKLKKPDLLQGTLDLLVLKMLAHGPQHGYGIAQKILLLSRETLASLGRHHLRQEPDAGNPLVRICGGGCGRP